MNTSNFRVSGIGRTDKGFFPTAGVEIDTGLQPIRCFAAVPWPQSDGAHRDVTLCGFDG